MCRDRLPMPEHSGLSVTSSMAVSPRNRRPRFPMNWIVYQFLMGGSVTTARYHLSPMFRDSRQISVVLLSRPYRGFSSTTRTVRSPMWTPYRW